MQSKKTDIHEQKMESSLNKKDDGSTKSVRKKPRTALPEEERAKRGRKITLVLFVVTILLSYMFYLQR